MVSRIEELRDKYTSKVVDSMLRLAREVRRDAFVEAADVCEQATAEGLDMPAVIERLRELAKV